MAEIINCKKCKMREALELEESELVLESESCESLFGRPDGPCWWVQAWLFC